jgi:hypothetical protein
MATDSKTLFDVALELQASDAPNVRQAVPFFNVKDIEASLRFYVDGLGFTITRQWEPDGRIRWCWLELGQVAVMLQEYWKDGRPGGWPTGPQGQGMSICFICADAITVTTIQEHEGSSRQGRLSATIYGSHRSLTRTDIAWTSRVLRTFPRTRSIPIRNDGRELHGRLSEPASWQRSHRGRNARVAERRGLRSQHAPRLAERLRGARRTRPGVGTPPV